MISKKIKEKLDYSYEERTGLVVRQNIAVDCFLKEFVDIDIKMPPRFLSWCIARKVNITSKPALTKEQFLRKLISLKVAKNEKEAESFLKTLLLTDGRGYPWVFTSDDCSFIPIGTYYTSPRIIFRNFYDEGTIWVQAIFSMYRFE